MWFFPVLYLLIQLRHKKVTRVRKLFGGVIIQSCLNFKHLCFRLDLNRSFPSLAHKKSFTFKSHFVIMTSKERIKLKTLQKIREGTIVITLIFSIRNRCFKKEKRSPPSLFLFQWTLTSWKISMENPWRVSLPTIEHDLLFNWNQAICFSSDD